MPNTIPGLRSPYSSVRNMVYLPRMLDKIRLHAQGTLPADYVPNLGKGFDGRCCHYLGVRYEDLSTWILAHTGSNDEAALEWAESQSAKVSPEKIEIWNGYMTKRGWRDDARPALEKRLQEAGLALDGPIQTFFDYLDFDEARPLHQG
jgi:gluconokinase